MHTPGPIKLTDADRDRIEDLVGTGKGAWDMIAMEDVVNGVVSWYFEKAYDEAEPEPLSDEEIDGIVQRVASPDLLGELVAALKAAIELPDVCATRYLCPESDVVRSAIQEADAIVAEARAVLAKLPAEVKEKP